MFRYRIHSADGEDLGEAAYASHIHVGDVIHHAGTKRYRVIAVIAIDDEPDSPYVGLLQVEPVE